MTRRVLAIDDQPEILDVIRLALDVTAGWSVTTASDAAAALSTTDGQPPYDAVLLDLSIPGNDAQRTVSSLRAAGVTGPVLLLTGADVSAADAKALGADGVLTKPFDPLALADAIEAALG